MPRQTVHRVLQQLADNGLVQRDVGRDRFRVGPGLTRLALRSLNADTARGTIRAILEALVEEVGETCNVGALDGADVVYIERVECHWPLRMSLSAGSRVPPHCTAIGKLLLAYLPEPLRSRYLEARPMARFTERTITDPGALLHALDEIRRRGYATNNQEYTLGLVALAVPVQDDEGKVLAGLAVHAPIARMSLPACRARRPALQRAAERIAAAWGLRRRAP
jgi:DNA-binding IclR family transcriptional regulator